MGGHLQALGERRQGRRGRGRWSGSSRRRRVRAAGEQRRLVRQAVGPARPGEVVVARADGDLRELVDLLVPLRRRRWTRTAAGCRSSLKPVIGSELIARHGHLSSCGSPSRARCRARPPAAGCSASPLRSIQRPSQPVLLLRSALASNHRSLLSKWLRRVLLGVDRGHHREIGARRRRCRRRRACRSRPCVAVVVGAGDRAVGERQRRAAPGRASASEPTRPSAAFGALAAMDERPRVDVGGVVARRRSAGHVQAVVAARQVQQDDALLAPGRRPPRRRTPRSAPSPSSLAA